MQEEATALVRRTLGAIPNPREVAFDYDRDSNILLVNFSPNDNLRRRSH